MLRDEAEGTGTAGEMETAETARADLLEIRERKSLRMTKIQTTTTRSICRLLGTIRETRVRARAISLIMGKAPGSAAAVETLTAVEMATASGSAIPETDRIMGFATADEVSAMETDRA